MRNFEEIFNELPEYVGNTLWQEHFAKKFKGTLKGLYHGVSVVALRALAEVMKEGLERASAEAADFMSSVNVQGDITQRFEICSNLTSELCPHIDIVNLSLTYYQDINKWAVEIIGANSKIGYQGSYPLLCFHENVVRNFLESEEFFVVGLHRLLDCDEYMAECEREVRRW